MDQFMKRAKYSMAKKEVKVIIQLISFVERENNNIQFLNQTR